MSESAGPGRSGTITRRGFLIMAGAGAACMMMYASQGEEFYDYESDMGENQTL